jgi:hypothetical protein
MIVQIPYKIITGLIYPAILGALIYSIYDYYYAITPKNWKLLLSIRTILILFFFFFYFFNFLTIMYETSYNWYAFISDFIETMLMYIGFKMLIDPEMNPEKNKLCLKKAYILGFFVLLNMIVWKIILADWAIVIFVMNIVSIVLMVIGWAWGHKKLWFNKYLMLTFCCLLVGLYAFAVCYNRLPK